LPSSCSVDRQCQYRSAMRTGTMYRISNKPIEGKVCFSFSFEGQHDDLTVTCRNKPLSVHTSWTYGRPRHPRLHSFCHFDPVFFHLCTLHHNPPYPCPPFRNHRMWALALMGMQVTSNYQELGMPDWLAFQHPRHLRRRFDGWKLLPTDVPYRKTTISTTRSGGENLNLECRVGLPKWAPKLLAVPQSSPRMNGQGHCTGYTLNDLQGHNLPFFLSYFILSFYLDSLCVSFLSSHLDSMCVFFRLI
jgi:hypothetical protein